MFQVSVALPPQMLQVNASTAPVLSNGRFLSKGSQFTVSVISSYTVYNVVNNKLNNV
jgi:hypothetical protein